VVLLLLLLLLLLPPSPPPPQRPSTHMRTHTCTPHARRHALVLA
jgi:hypothetical protein